jgi:hypothetical protein
MSGDEDQRRLGEFRSTGSQAAFARLVARHVDLVYSAARRRVGDAPLDFRVEKGIITISTAPDIALSEKRAPVPATQKSPASAPRR